MIVRLRMLAMWALRFYSPSVGYERAVTCGLRAGLSGGAPCERSCAHRRNGIPTLREALRGRWDK